MHNIKYEIYNKIKTETLIISKINYIFKKLEIDKSYQQIFQLFFDIINKEYNFVKEELIKEKYFNLNNLQDTIKNNTYIFKENLKLITNSIIEEIWKKDWEYNKKINFGKSKILFNEKIPEIREEDEFNSNNFYSSINLSLEKDLLLNKKINNGLNINDFISKENNIISKKKKKVNNDNNINKKKTKNKRKNLSNDYTTNTTSNNMFCKKNKSKNLKF